jgi:hypothetical protein
LFGGSGPSGSNLVGGTHHSITFCFHILVGGQPQVGGKPHIGGQPRLGGKPQFGGHNHSYGQSIPALQSQPWNIPFQGNQQPSRGQLPQVNDFVSPNLGQLYPGSTNITLGKKFQSNVPFQGNIPNQPNHVGYFPQNTPQLNLSGLSNYLETAYGPTSIHTGLPLQNYQFPQVNKQFPFLATLDLPDLSRILNDPILHSPYWPFIPSKLPSDIPKFDGRSGEDPNNHAMTFHLWCSSNSLMDDSIRLRLFQRTLMGSETKWYIELPRGLFNDFNTLAMAFLMHYQLPIRYETGTKILSSFKQSSSTYIFDHIYEWRRRRHLIKVPLPGQLLVEWFTKSLIGPIAHDVAMGGVVTEEQAISHAQYLDLVYFQTGTLYDLIPDAPLRSTNPTPTHPIASHAANGVIGTFHVETQSLQASHTNPKSNNSNVQNTPTLTPSSGKTSEVNSVQSTSTRKNKNKNKGKGKNKEDKNNNQWSDKAKTQPTDEKGKCKPRYPCLICGDDHYTKYCPQHTEATKFFQGTRKPPTPVVLSQPFPSQQQAQLVIHDQLSPSTSSYVLMCIGDSNKNEVVVRTRAKDYPPSKEKVDDIPPSLVQLPPPTSPPNGPLHLEGPGLDTVLHPHSKGVV